MTKPTLHVVAPPALADLGRGGTGATCRRAGCFDEAEGELGFCVPCRDSYNVTKARRRRMIELVCWRLRAAGDPLFAVFGSYRPKSFGAHVVAHLEELDATWIHVPPSAVDDYLAELDELADVTG